MSSSYESIFKRYLTFFEELTPETVEDIRALVVDDLHFVDPFNDVRSTDKVIHIFNDMYKKLKDPRFVIVESFVKDNKMYCLWEFTLRTPLLKWGKPHVIYGSSYVIANQEGKIAEHIDYWDASTQLYMHLPIIGILIRIIRKVMA